MLNWQHIKGVYGSTNPIYTYIEFSDALTNTDNKSVGALPYIYVSNTNSSDRDEIETFTNLGQLVTSKATGQVIEEDFTFSKKVYLFNHYLTTANNGNILTTNFQAIDFGTSGMSVKNLTVNEKLTVNQTSTFNGSVEVVNSTLTCGQTKLYSDHIDAIYFNATSDRRAKEDPLPFNGKALDIINQIQTYTYKYKDTKQVSYGVMAQDLLDIQINDFSFVENAAATGQDGDYMSVRESKLVYLLLEGIKELQIEVNNLRKEVEELRNGK